MESERIEDIANFPRKRMGAGALFVDELNRVLLVEPTYKDYWEIPGGVVENGESPYTAVVREIREELGLDVSPGRLLVVDWVSPGLYPDDGVMMIFDGSALTADQIAAIALPADELRSWAWCDPAESQTGYRKSDSPRGGGTYQGRSPRDVRPMTSRMASVLGGWSCPVRTSR
ncbi:NUDIX hydrolase [Nocardia salmonicida]|uniref:NUDIX hydrolase n=1 Tax=Nocardia salmonicida TaxID=53431 RepID=UPI0034490EB4